MTPILTANTHQPTGGYEVTIKNPSDLRSKGSKGSTSFTLDFVLRDISDYRLMYSDVQTMRERISKGVCVVDFSQAGAFQLEIKVPTNSTLTQVLEATDAPRLKNWTAVSQPYVTIIKKSAILSQTGSEDFLRTNILPGDFIVVRAIQ